MDPHISPEQPGLSQDLSKSDDAVNYLRRQKGPVAEGARLSALVQRRAPSNTCRPCGRSGPKRYPSFTEIGHNIAVTTSNRCHRSSEV